MRARIARPDCRGAGQFGLAERKVEVTANLAPAALPLLILMPHAAGKWPLSQAKFSGIFATSVFCGVPAARCNMPHVEAEPIVAPRTRSFEERAPT